MRTVVIGGGIIGLASAYYLATQGESVVLIERGALGMESTGRSVGGIRKQYSTEINVRLSQLSAEIWESFTETFGVDIEFRQSGYLYLTRDASTARRFEETVDLHHELGVETELLDAQEAAEVCPALHAQQFLAATYLATDGFADPSLAVRGFADAARASGVDIRTRTTVTDVLTEANRVTGVMTSDGPVDATSVVNATGAWLAQIAAMVGIDLPVTPRRRQVLTVDPELSVPESVPLTIDLDSGVYFRPEHGGLAFIGGHFDGTEPPVDPDTYRTRFDLPWATEALEYASQMAGYFGPETAIRNGWAGLYAVTPDHHPIIDEVMPGFIVVGGFSGHGFQHAPAAGQLVAELVVTGESSLLDIHPLRLERFNDGDFRIEQNVA